ncbi:MAG: hypothetical protein COU69_01730 [Candidatus Pacebacteria bacterium CG10_big_fil_rev_8_21_14_0_10_56_10]|nr:MAG: hypothetical protein COU69_01730 [Candidatus Pacebacteria bacterium CG10_big_fil_rev_8_21_14_0_10_56_10]
MKALPKLATGAGTSWVLLAVILLGGLAVRLYNISTPLADWHSWRQADTASVTREYLKHNHPWLLPHYHDLSNIASGLPNPEGWRLVEFPILSIFTAQLLRLQPQWDLVVTSRLVTVALSLASVALLYDIVRLTSGRRGLALAAAAVMAFLPYSIYYSRVILPEPAMVTMVLVSIWSMVRWLAVVQTRRPARWAWYLISITTLAVALLLKPTAAFFGTIYVALVWQRWGSQAWRQPLLWAYALAFAPLLWWRNWIEQYPAGIPAFEWLLNGNGIRLRPAWWRWLFGDRIGRLMLGFWGVVPALVGTMVKSKGSRGRAFDQLTLAWLAGNLLYLVVFATGNVQHDYYQIMLVPGLAVAVARGGDWLWHQAGSGLYRWLSYSLLAVTAGLGLFLGWFHVRGYYQINVPAIVFAGRRVNQLTPPDAKVIAPYGGDTAFLFQTDRTGWPVGGDINSKRAAGATHYVTTTLDDEARQLLESYRLVEQTDQYLILDLTESL